MTSEAGRAYVWAWLPGATVPVVAGVLERTDRVLDREPVLVFAYARSFVDRPEALSLFPPELPLRRGTFDPTGPAAATGWRGYAPVSGRSPLPVAGCLRDAAPDAWGRRVLNLRLAGDADVDLSELDYLLASDSDRIGALDFQRSPSEHVPRGTPATLEQLVRAAELIDEGAVVPADLVAAAQHGTSIGGARPKALLDDGGRRLIAKFSSSTDDRPVVKAEAVGMLLAGRVGIDVAPVEMVRSAGRDALLVERFDRPADGTRRSVVSALTILGLRDTESRHGSYAELAEAIRLPGWTDPSATLRELFLRLVLNVCIGNSDDHLRNHAAYWDGTALTLTPAYDLAPQRRSTSVSSQAIGITRDGERAAQLRVCRKVAQDFLLSSADAEELIDHVVDTIRTTWDDVCDEATLTAAERQILWGREILNDFVFWDRA